MIIDGHSHMITENIFKDMDVNERIVGLLKDDWTKHSVKEHVNKWLDAMNRNEIEKIAKNKKEELAITDVAKKGMLMSVLMKELKGKADGSAVKEVVDSLF